MLHEVLFCSWVTFGGSTCLLFFLCYLCQRKYHVEEPPLPRTTRNVRTTPQQVYVISSLQAPTLSRNNPQQQQPPPDYESALRQKSLYEDPPSYEAAMCSIRSPPPSTITV